MGYTTEFAGRFDLNREIDNDTFNLLKGLATTRRMKRDNNMLEELGFGNAEDFGIEGEFFYNNDGDFGQSQDDSIINYNSPSKNQPSLWLQWIPTEDRKGLEWDGGEKFYSSVNWIEYLINRILEPRGYIVNGTVNAQGEDSDDQYHIRVVNNVVEKIQGFSLDVDIPTFDWYDEDEY